MDQYRDQNIPGDQNSMSRPQVFVHLEFGISWSQRHQPRTHAVTYTSRNLRDSRTRNYFPRQIPPPNANFLATDGRQQRLQEPRDRVVRINHQLPPHHQLWLQDQTQRTRGGQQQEPRSTHDRPMERSRQEPSQNRETSCDRRSSRSDSRGLSHERGKSAPPPFHNSPWDTVAGPSEPLSPSAGFGNTERREQPRVWKPLPPAPDSFRLGEGGLPWSAWAWPAESQECRRSEEAEEELPFSNQPTTVTISPNHRRDDDPERVRELESLSAAMVTVDNGFESQWWYQGPRETTAWWPRDQEEPARLSMADALLLSAAEPPANAPPHGWYAPSYEEHASYLDEIVSPISTISPARPLQRSLTTRSEELFVTSLGDGSGTQ